MNTPLLLAAGAFLLASHNSNAASAAPVVANPAIPVLGASNPSPATGNAAKFAAVIWSAVIPANPIIEAEGEEAAIFIDATFPLGFPVGTTIVVAATPVADDGVAYTTVGLTKRASFLPGATGDFAVIASAHVVFDGEIVASSPPYLIPCEIPEMV